MTPVSSIQPAAAPYLPVTPAGPVPAVKGGSEKPAPQADQRAQRTLHEVVTDLNESMQSINTSISFSIDSANKKTVIKVSDASTGKVIRQIPQEDMLRIAAHLNELVGLLYDHTR